ncbi:MAG: NUDIX domain-containing protein [Chloroflexota bacterium]
MPLRTRCGYSLGVGGLVWDGQRVLLVRRVFEPNAGRWTFPSGWVEAAETVDEAAVREVREETGVRAEVIGALGLRQRASPGDNNLLVFLLLRPLAGEPVPDNVEVDGAAYFSPDEALANPDFIELNKTVLRRLLETGEPALLPTPCPPTPQLPGRYVAFT